MSTRRARSSVTGEQTEAGWQSAVIGLARLYGWRIFHAPDNRPAGRSGRPQNTGGDPGYPDLTLARGSRLLFVELKSRTGRLGPGQREWLDALEDTGASTYLWRPADWPDVQRVLGAGQVYRCDLDPLDEPRS